VFFVVTGIFIAFSNLGTLTLYLGVVCIVLIYDGTFGSLTTDSMFILLPYLSTIAITFLFC